jgi:Icc-related predicted phosphoesterase
MILLCLADIHGKGSELERIIAASTGEEILVIAGDVTRRGGYEEAERILLPAFSAGRKVIAVGGNMDGEGAVRYLGEKGVDIHGRGISVDGIGFQGLGGSNPTPFGTPFELQADEAEELLAAGYSDIADCPFKVLVSHEPPRDTKLDRSGFGVHIGSDQVRRFILSHPMDVCISGHVHESPGEDSLGQALCLNIGPCKAGRYALVRIQGGKAAVEWRHT